MRELKKKTCGWCMYSIAIPHGQSDDVSYLMFTGEEQKNDVGMKFQTSCSL